VRLPIPVGQTDYWVCEGLSDGKISRLTDSTNIRLSKQKQIVTAIHTRFWPQKAAQFVKTGDFNLTEPHHIHRFDQSNGVGYQAHHHGSKFLI
jgi:hypothetical protein